MFEIAAVSRATDEREFLATASASFCAASHLRVYSTEPFTTPGGGFVHSRPSSRQRLAFSSAALGRVLRMSLKGASWLLPKKSGCFIGFGPEKVFMHPLHKREAGVVLPILET